MNTARMRKYNRPTLPAARVFSELDDESVIRDWITFVKDGRAVHVKTWESPSTMTRTVLVSAC